METIVQPRSKECSSMLGAVQDALYVLNGKWKIPILIALMEGHKRFGGLQQAVQGISAKVLSQELKHLELNGFLVRHVYDSMPVTVEYELTSYSKSLQPVMDALRDWGLKHRKRIRENFH